MPTISPITTPDDLEARRNGSTEKFSTIHQPSRTISHITLSEEQWEKLYLTPKTHVSGQLRTTFGNPTPLYVSSLLPRIRT